MKKFLCANPSTESQLSRLRWPGLQLFALFEVCRELVSYIPCLQGISPLRLQPCSSNHPASIQGWAQPQNKGSNCSGWRKLSWCGLGADLGVCCSRAGGMGGSQFLPPGIPEGAIPSCRSPEDLLREQSWLGRRRRSKVWKRSRNYGQSELPVRRGKFPSLLAGPWMPRAPRLVRARIC